MHPVSASTLGFAPICGFVRRTDSQVAWLPTTKMLRGMRPMGACSRISNSHASSVSGRDWSTRRTQSQLGDPAKHVLMMMGLPSGNCTSAVGGRD